METNHVDRHKATFSCLISTLSSSSLAGRWGKKNHYRQATLKKKKFKVSFDKLKKINSCVSMI